MAEQTHIDNASTKWRLVDPSELVLTEFDEGLVVFHRPSGQTHVLNALAAEAFTFLSEAALTRDQLAGRLIEVIENDADQELGSAVDAIIERLELLGLVDRVDA